MNRTAGGLFLGLGTVGLLAAAIVTVIRKGFAGAAVILLVMGVLLVAVSVLSGLFGTRGSST